MGCNVKDVFIDIAIERKTLMGETVLEKIQLTYCRVCEYQRQQGLLPYLILRLIKQGFGRITSIVS